MLNFWQFCFGQGQKAMSVIDVSHALLIKFDGLRNLTSQNWQSLKVVPGIAGVKAITLVCSI